MCKRWMDSFVDFLSDMGLKPTGTETLERIDNAKGYEPGNCKWLPKPLQSKNRRSNKPLTFNGQTKLLSEWARDLGLQRTAVSRRLRCGWPIERALTQPKQ